MNVIWPTGSTLYFDTLCESMHRLNGLHWVTSPTTGGTIKEESIRQPTSCHNYPRIRLSNRKILNYTNNYCKICKMLPWETIVFRNMTEKKEGLFKNLY